MVGSVAVQERYALVGQVTDVNQYRKRETLRIVSIAEEFV